MAYARTHRQGAAGEPGRVGAYAGAPPERDRSVGRGRGGTRRGTTRGVIL
ncbi:MAG: hypothetical protein AVDCRST_MAG11-1249 [uncultured Gemmatimonadaceae bacterium]|uniref:Uncharacterized protein n=1 Tax=uncultured Gemmatimonadaceae bacterium TaxID=246130 RepID=A0A6J4KK44_9BACT|nr:MAG: hypothetical protein AVDCRST_MAG11-1249 [uncultured Gemmatimonadaceae bacterium]